VVNLRKKKKAERLDNYSHFDVHKWSDYPQVKTVTDKLYKILQKKKLVGGNTSIEKKHLRVLLLDLFANWTEDSKKYTAIYKGSNHYKQSIYNALHISRKIVKLVNILKKEGYLREVVGYQDQIPERSRKTRIRANKKLIDLLIKCHLEPHMIDQAPTRVNIVLRGEKLIVKGKGKKVKKTGEEIDYTQDKQYKKLLPTINKLRQDMCAYNNLIRRTFIAIPYFPKKGIQTRNNKRRIRINHSNNFIRRIFNDGSFKKGGRYYGGWWTRLPSLWRKRICINDHKVVEVDYSGIHIVILYALKGIDYWKTVDKDPYDISGIEHSETMRKLMKVILLSSINAVNKGKAKKAILYEINIEQKEEFYDWYKNSNIDINKIMDSFVEFHEPIKDMFFSNMGIELQYADSRMAEIIINYFTKKEIPVLCVFDSFIIELKHKSELIEKMHEAFREIMREFYRGKDYIASQIKIEEKDRMDEKKRRIELKLDRGAKDRSTVIELMKGIDLERRSKVYYPKVKLKVIDERISKEEDKYNRLHKKDDKEFMMSKRIYKERVWDRNYYYF
jgi:hypothetical protein